MKTLLQLLTWTSLVWIVIALADLTITNQMNGPIWVFCAIVAAQTILTLVYIHQHDRLGKDQAKQAEHDRIKAEVLAELN